MNQSIQQLLESVIPLTLLQNLATAITPYFIVLGLSFAL
jgi:hypothetical protein